MTPSANMPRATSAIFMHLKDKLDERLVREGRDGTCPGLLQFPSFTGPCSISRAGLNRTFSRTTADRPMSERRHPQERAVKQRWAVPGSAHDRLVRWSKVVLPMRGRRADRDSRCGAARQRAATSASSSTRRRSRTRPSGCGSKPRATSAPTTRARGSRSPPTRAIQRSSDVPIVDIRGMFARLALEPRARC